MKNKLISIVCVQFFFIGFVFSQYPRGYFDSPVRIPIMLSGNFAELRANHFHAGLDIKTLGGEGLPIYACAEGYVWRVRISPDGYGKVVYIKHPNGYVTVYAHLREFADSVASYVLRQQHSLQKNYLDIYPSPSDAPVKRGELIAYSGNTGSSGGPHLHFEIRDGVTENAINPLLFGFDVADDVPPVIYTLAVYPLAYDAKVNNQRQRFDVGVFGSGSSYTTTPIEVSGTVGFGIVANDFVSATGNRCGIYGIKLWVDDSLLTDLDFDEVSFYESRYINSYIDYADYKRNNRRIQKLYVDANNKLNIYNKKNNNGTYDFNDNKSHVLRIEITDAYGNQTLLKTTLQSRAQKNVADLPDKNNYDMLVYANKVNYLIRDNVRMIVPRDALYDDLYMQFDESAGVYGGAYSTMFSIYNTLTPVQEPIALSLRADNLPEHLRDKALIASVGGGMVSQSGAWIDGFVTAWIRGFGSFVVTVDTIPPSISPVNIGYNSNLSMSRRIDFVISDNLSGIAAVNAYIDERWVILEHDAKTKRLWHVFDQPATATTHTLRVEVTDKKNNVGVYETKFYR